MHALSDESVSRETKGCNVAGTVTLAKLNSYCS